MFILRLLRYANISLGLEAPVIPKFSTLRLLPRNQVAAIRHALSSKWPSTRQQKIDATNSNAAHTLARIESRFPIFLAQTTKVVDLGFAPGNWLTYARDRLASIHNVDVAKIHRSCTLVGLDLLFATPPRGTHTTQGNVYSQGVQNNVMTLLKEAALRRLESDLRETPEVDDLYLDKEARLERDFAAVPSQFGEADRRRPLMNLLGYSSWQADVVLSDLGPPFLQDKGFYNNTHSKPYIRSRTNTALRQTITEPGKSSLDLADAALIFCCDKLVKGGKFVVSVRSVDLADPEVLLFESRLQLVFHKVSRWSTSEAFSSEMLKPHDLYFLCGGKKDYVIRKEDVFLRPKL